MFRHTGSLVHGRHPLPAGNQQDTQEYHHGVNHKHDGHQGIPVLCPDGCKAMVPPYMVRLWQTITRG